MTAAEKYRQLEISPSVQVARWIFNNRLNNAPRIPLRDVVEDIKTGKTPSKDEKKYYESGVLDWFKPSEIGEGKYLTSASDKLSQLAIDAKQATIYQPGTLLIIGIGAGIGRLAITKNIASSNQQITGIAFNDSVLPEYAYYYFLAYREFFYVGASKSTIPIINQKKITSIPFIFCSAKEQKIIVDFLTAIELIKLPQDVGGLIRLTDDAELLGAAKRIFAIHFAAANLVVEFDKQETHLIQLRQALLREAMQGQLLPQDPTDEPAAVLLQQLQAAAKPGKGGRGKATPLFAEEAETVEGPFEIPASWVWCQVGDICESITDCVNKTAPWTETVTPFKMLRTSNIRHGRIDTDNVRHVSAETYQKWTVRDKPLKGDMILTREAPLGEVALVEEDDTIFLGQRLVQYRANENVLSREFLFYTFRGPIMQKQLRDLGLGAFVKHLRVPDSKVLLIPLPPLAEQHRIVAKLAQLLQYCDALEQRIRESRRLAEKLLATALREALAPPTGTEPAPAPETYLEAATPRRRGRTAQQSAAPLFEGLST